MTTTCSHEGCSSPALKHKRHCNRHWLNLRRYGHTMGRGEKVLGDLLDAANALDRPVLSVRLIEAAIAYGHDRCRSLRFKVTERPGVTSELGAAAWAYTEHDEHAPLSSFKEARERLRQAALRFYMALPAVSAGRSEAA